MSESTDLARREQGDALSTILGGGDTRAMLAEVERNVKDIIAVARDRGFVRRYGDNEHEFFGEPAWALLGMTYGLVPFMEWTREVKNGWEARAVIRTRDGSEVGAAEAMCTRAEGNRRNATDHTLRAMAQTRARRNALRSVLGASLVLAGFDFADPEGPATKAQIGVLHQLERELGMTHDEGHHRAGADSFKDLTREQAGEIIDAWTAERDGKHSAARPENEDSTRDATHDVESPRSDMGSDPSESAAAEQSEGGEPRGRFVTSIPAEDAPSSPTNAEMSGEEGGRVDNARDKGKTPADPKAAPSPDSPTAERSEEEATERSRRAETSSEPSGGEPSPRGDAGSLSDAPASSEQWSRALKVIGPRRKVVALYTQFFREEKQGRDITRDEMAQLIEAKTTGVI